MFKTNETKPFYLTSEFYLLVIGTALTVAAELPLSPTVKAVVVAVLGGAYTISRGVAKSGTEYEPEKTKEAVTPPVAAPPAFLAEARELLTEHPELVQQLKAEGVIV